jgi:TolB-like protein
MKKGLFLMALFVFGGFSAFAQQLPTVAVATFDRAGGVTADEAQVVTELFIAELVSTGGVNVVDRTNFDKIIAEMKFQVSDWSNSQKTAQLGRALNAGYIIRGQLMKMGNAYYWTATMMNINTAQALYSAREQVNDMGEIFNKLPVFVKQIADNIPMPNYFVGRWRSASGGNEMIIEFFPNGTLTVYQYQIKVYDYNYNLTGNGLYSYDSGRIKLTINLNHSIEFNYKDWMDGTVKTRFGPSVSIDTEFTFTNSKTSFTIKAKVMNAQYLALASSIFELKPGYFSSSTSATNYQTFIKE